MKLFLSILSIMILFSCGKNEDKNMIDKVEIIIQHFHGCPNGPKMIENVKTAMKGIEDNINFSEQIIDKPELAKEFIFRGSPTLLVNGEDIEGMKAPENPDLSCRLYPNGLPSVEKIRKRIEENLKIIKR